MNYRHFKVQSMLRGPGELRPRSPGVEESEGPCQRPRGGREQQEVCQEPGHRQAHQEPQQPGTGVQRPQPVWGNVPVSPSRMGLGTTGQHLRG